MDFTNGKNISIIIASYLRFSERLEILKRTIQNLRKYFPLSEIIVLFDKFGVENLDDVDKCIIHNKGLGYSWNYGIKIAKNDYILQTEDDWVLKTFITTNITNDLINKSFKLLINDKVKCVRMDGAMFDIIGGSNGYPLGYEKKQYEDIEYYIYNIPTDKDIEKNGWLKYYFCNHPHLKIREKLLDFKYLENDRPNKVETQACLNWRQNKYNCAYISLFNKKNKSYFKHIGGKFSYSKK